MAGYVDGKLTYDVTSLNASVSVTTPFIKASDAANSIAVPNPAANDTFVVLSGVQTMSGKTLLSPVLQNAVVTSATLTQPVITSGALTSPTIQSGTWTGPSVTGGNWLSGAMTQPVITSGSLTSPSITGGIFSAGATTAQMTAAAATNAMVTPFNQGDHPSAAKAWVTYGIDGTVYTAYNITSVVRAATGIFNVFFSSAAPTVYYTPSISIYGVYPFGLGVYAVADQSAGGFVVNFMTVGTGVIGTDNPSYTYIVVHWR